MFKSKFESKNIALIYASSIIGGMVFFLPIIALYLEQDLFNITNVAIIFSIEALALFLFEVPTGAIADLFGRKKTMVLANIVVLIGVVFLYIGGSMLVFILFAIFNSLARALASGTDSALIYDTLKEENKEHLYKKTVGRYHSLWPLGASIGSVIGGYLASVSLSFPALMSLIPFSIVLMLSFFIKEPKYEKEDHKNIFKHMFNVSKVIVDNKQLILLMVIGFIMLGVGESIHRMGSLFFKFKEIPLVYFGWITALIFGGSSIGHFLSHGFSEKFGNKKTLILCIIGSPLLILLATLTVKYTSILLFIIPSLFFGLRRPVISHLLNIEVSSSKRATIISMYNFMGQLGMAIFIPFLGYFADLYTINTAYMASASLMFLAVLFILFIRERN
jgi:MFS family permease